MFFNRIVRSGEDNSRFAEDMSAGICGSLMLRSE
jgi:hypothetical protein